MLAREAQNVQNPALGAAILWRFCCSYTTTHPTSDAPALPTLFMVLPIVLHQATAELLRRTRPSSGLRAFAAKFGESAVAKQEKLSLGDDANIGMRTPRPHLLMQSYSTSNYVCGSSVLEYVGNRPRGAPPSQT